MSDTDWVPISFNESLPAEAQSDSQSPFEEVDQLSLDILSEARTSLMMAFRFLDMALWRMPFKTGNLELPLATNGKMVFVSPYAVILRFQEGYNEIIRDLLHTVLHCIFRHPYDTEHLNIPAWSLACDIVVESVAIEMCEKRFSSVQDVARLAEIAGLQAALGSLSPLKLYRLFANAELNARSAVEKGYNAAKIWDLRMLFQRDSHEAWANQKEGSGSQETKDKDGSVRRKDLSDRLDNQEEDPEDQPDMIDMDHDLSPEGDTDESEEDLSDAQNQDLLNQLSVDADQDADSEFSETDAASSNSADMDTSMEADSDGEGDAQGSGEAGHSNEDAEGSSQPDIDSQGSSSHSKRDASQPDERSDADDGDNPFDSDDLSEISQEQWEQIAKQIEEDLQTFSKNHDGDAGSLMANLAIANRNPVDYTDFLRQFSTMGEDMKINDDEFDYIFYTYGLDVYGNMPLVEPLEYQERDRVREFVIAIDTSGSCAGDLVKNFVMRTYQILRENEEFGDEVNIHIIQCDCRIQADLKIERVEDLEKYCENFQAFGFGGTDFRPVFQYVNDLIEKGEFENLRGLIYFTDGYGTFPNQMPEYETAFVFVNEGGSSIKVPPWAMRVILDEDEIRTL